MSRATEPLTRRQALARLGLGLGAVYCAPYVAGLSAARADENDSSSSSTPSSSDPEPPDDPDPGDDPGPDDAKPDPTDDGESSEDTGPDRESAPRTGCTAPSGPTQASISRRDMQSAQAAVARGDAKPLREIVAIVQREHPGRLLRVGFRNNGGTATYWLRMVAGGGVVQTVQVDAGSGRVTSIGGC